MASGEIDLVPGRVLGPEELIDNDKLNDLGMPTLRVKALAITARELADGAINADKLSVDLEAQLGVPDNSVTTAKLVDSAVTPQKQSETARIPIGSVMSFAGASAPTGWLFCAGQAVSRVTYADLFTVIGITYGSGDGASTFNVPDLRGRLVAGKDDMGGVSANRLSVKLTCSISSGSDAVTLASGDTLTISRGDSVTGTGIPADTTIVEVVSTTTFTMSANATATSASALLTIGAVASLSLGGAGGSRVHQLGFYEMPLHIHNYQLVGPGAGGVAAGAGVATGATPTTAAGNDQPHNNVQPTMILNHIIRYA
jgi:microcystin-dependent protein